MKFSLRFVAIALAICAVTSCTMTPDEQYVRQEIPVEIEAGKPVTVKIASLSGNAENQVGIRCSPAEWKALSAGSNSISVRLVSSSSKSSSYETRVYMFSSGGPMMWPVDSAIYLFSIGGESGTSAFVEITFPSAPAGPTSAKIIVLNTPADTGL